MNRFHLPNYNLDITLLGGQSFTWDRIAPDHFRGFTSSKIVEIKREGEYVYWQTYPELDDEGWIKRYLRVDADKGEILTKHVGDVHMKAAIEKYSGLHLLHQDFEDTLVSFLCSATKSIVGIRQCVRLLARHYGDTLEIDGQAYDLFPTLEQLADVDEAELRKLTKVGFRAPNIILAARHMLDTGLHDEIHTYDTDIARRELMELRGVGDKVADCILVYGLARDEVTPFDIWGKRFMVQYYGMDPDAKYEHMRQYTQEMWGDKAAWVGQYLFEYIREAKV